MTKLIRKFPTKLLPAALAISAFVILASAFVLSTTYSSSVLAQGGATPAPAVSDGSNGFVPCGNKVNEPCTIDHLFLMLVLIINYAISMAGLVAIFFIIFAGIRMLTSRGEEGLREAKGQLNGAVIGLVIIAVAYVLVNSLFVGSFSIGVYNGQWILTNPKTYIQSADTRVVPKPTTPTTPTPPTNRPPGR
jgi:hypothetical protein